MRSNALEGISDEALRRMIRSLIRKIPDDFSNINYSSQQDDIISTPKAGNIPRSSSGRLRTFVDRVHSVAKTHQQRLINNLPSSPGSSEFLDRSDPSSPVSSTIPAIEVPKVMIFSLTDGHAPLGLEPEEKIMNSIQPVNSRKHTTSDSLAEKKTRFKATESVVSDHTGTTEADPGSDVDDEEEGGASICSSINDNIADDAEDVSTLPDNFSDTVPISANVSGRGSPSLSGGGRSGRGTPFSGGGAGQEPNNSVSSTVAEAASGNQNDSHRNLPKLPVTIRRQNPEGLEEKFGKFGLPPQDPTGYRDETYSLVSDSWSIQGNASLIEGRLFSLFFFETDFQKNNVRTKCVTQKKRCFCHVSRL